MTCRFQRIVSCSAGCRVITLSQNPSSQAAYTHLILATNQPSSLVNKMFKPMTSEVMCKPTKSTATRPSGFNIGDKAQFSRWDSTSATHGFLYVMRNVKSPCELEVA